MRQRMASWHCSAAPAAPLIDSGGPYASACGILAPPSVGGSEMTVSTGDHLSDLFDTETWREHFSILSDILGFSLSVYTLSGKTIFAPKGKFPYCQSFLTTPSEINAHCDSHCQSFIAKAV